MRRRRRSPCRSAGRRRPPRRIADTARRRAAPHAAQNRAPAGISAWQRAQGIGVRAAGRRHHRPAAKPMASIAGACAAIRAGPLARIAARLAGSTCAGIQSSAFLRPDFRVRRRAGTKAASLRPGRCLRRRLHVSDLQRRRSPRNESSSYAHDQPARPPWPRDRDRQVEVAGAAGRPAAPRRLHPRLHDDARRSRTRRCARSPRCA